jgi:hypothetical protein
MLIKRLKRKLKVRIISLSYILISKRGFIANKLLNSFTLSITIL